MREGVRERASKREGVAKCGDELVGKWMSR